MFSTNELLLSFRCVIYPDFNRGLPCAAYFIAAMGCCFKTLIKFNQPHRSSFRRQEKSLKVSTTSNSGDVSLPRHDVQRTLLIIITLNY
jgi:hypothetical protein